MVWPGPQVGGALRLGQQRGRSRGSWQGRTVYGAQVLSGVPAEDGGDDDDNMKIDPVTKGIKKVRNQNVTELVQEIADDVDEKVIERLQQQAIERGNIEAARKRGRREAVTDIEHSPLKNVPFVTAKHIDPKTFTFSIDVCESVLDGMRERLDGVKAHMKKLVEEGKHAGILLQTEMPIVLGGDYNVIPQKEDAANPVINMNESDLERTLEIRYTNINVITHPNIDTNASCFGSL